MLRHSSKRSHVSRAEFFKRPEIWMTRTVTAREEISIIELSADRDCGKVGIGTRMMKRPVSSAKFTTIFEGAPTLPKPSSPHRDRTVCRKEKMMFSSEKALVRDRSGIISQRMYRFRSRPAIRRETKFSASLIAI